MLRGIPHDFTLVVTHRLDDSLWWLAVGALMVAFLALRGRGK